MTRPGVVSVVLVNHEDADSTIGALEGLDAIDWPGERLERIVVDDASSDGSVARIRAKYPDIKIVELDDRSGRAAASNRGVDVATGDHVAFLAIDVRPDKEWLTAGAAVLSSGSGVVCVASKILDADGNIAGYGEPAMTFCGHAFSVQAGEPDTRPDGAGEDVLFASSAAMIVDAEVFRDAGGFDERYFMHFEDVDFCWRLWLLGYRVRYAPGSVVIQDRREPSDSDSLQHDFLRERNALFTIFKNYDDTSLRTAFGPALLLAIRRGRLAGNEDPAATRAIDALGSVLPELARDRARVQARRSRPDHEILRLFRLPLSPDVDDPGYVQTFQAAMDAFGVSQTFTSRRRILIATADVIQPRMAGPGIRAWHMAVALSRQHDVQLVSMTACLLEHPDFATRYMKDDKELARTIDWSDVVIFMGNLMKTNPELRTTDRVVVADIYDPFHLEVLEQARERDWEHRRTSARTTKEVLNEQLMRADFFLCASEKQRDFWLGQLAAVGRINPATYDEDESLESLIAVVPFGVNDDPPATTRPVLRGRVPGIGAEDKIILWGGGIYSWFDPLTLLRAVDKLRLRVPEVRLYFMGTKHPNMHVPEMRIVDDTIALADELGLNGEHVFFNDDWVAYEDRANYLLEADVGVSTHLDHIETAFSFRTRILDYFWASLPVVATAGDSLAFEIEEAGAGITVPPGDVDALEAALFDLLTDDDRRATCQKASAGLADRFRWTKTLAPLTEFCNAPRRAPDLVDPLVVGQIGDPLRARLLRRKLQKDLGIVSQHLRDGDLNNLARRAWGRLRRIVKPR